VSTNRCGIVRPCVIVFHGLWFTVGVIVITGHLLVAVPNPDQPVRLHFPLSLNTHEVKHKDIFCNAIYSTENVGKYFGEYSLFFTDGARHFFIAVPNTDQPVSFHFSFSLNRGLVKHSGDHSRSFTPYPDYWTILEENRTSWPKISCV